MIPSSEPFRFFLSPGAKDLWPVLNGELGWPGLEPRQEIPGEPVIDGVLQESQLFLPGSGLAKMLYTQWYTAISLT